MLGFCSSGSVERDICAIPSRQTRLTLSDVRPMWDAQGTLVIFLLSCLRRHQQCSCCLFTSRGKHRRASGGRFHGEPSRTPPFV